MSMAQGWSEVFMGRLAALRANANYGSWDEVAKALLEGNARLRAEIKPRSLAAKLSDFDNGKANWWAKRRQTLEALAGLLEVDVETLLEGQASPEDPSQFAIDALPFIGSVHASPGSLWPAAFRPTDGEVHDSTWHVVQEYLHTASVRLWVTLDDAIEVAALVALLRAEGFTVERRATLAEAAQIQSRTRRLVVVVERADPDSDLDDVLKLDRNAVDLVVAPFAIPTRRGSSDVLFDSHELQAGLRDGRGGPFGAVGDFLHRPHERRPNWRQDFVRWVGRRLATGTPTLLDTAELLKWLAATDPDATVFANLEDLCALLCHAHDRPLPKRAADLRVPWLRAAVQSRPVTGAPEIWLRKQGADALMALAGGAWRDATDPWDSARSERDWAEHLRSAGCAPSVYAAAASASRGGLPSGPRTDAAIEAVHELATTTDAAPTGREGVDWLEAAGIMRDTGRGLEVAPRWLLRWCLRDWLLTRLVDVDAIGEVFSYAAEASRRAFLEAQLGAMSTPTLCEVIAAAARIPPTSFARALAADVLTRALAQHLQREPSTAKRMGAVVDDIDRLGLALRIGFEGPWATVQLITRRNEFSVESRALSYAMDRWAISGALEPPGASDRTGHHLDGWRPDGWRALGSTLGEAFANLVGLSQKLGNSGFPGEKDKQAQQRAENDCVAIARRLALMAPRWTFDALDPNSVSLLLLPGIVVELGRRGAAVPIRALQRVAEADWAVRVTLALANAAPDAAEPSTRVAIANAWFRAVTPDPRWLACLRVRDFDLYAPLRYFVAEHVDPAVVAEEIDRVPLATLASQWSTLRPEARGPVLRRIAETRANLSTIATQQDCLCQADQPGLAHILELHPNALDLAPAVWRLVPPKALALLKRALETDGPAGMRWLDACPDAQLGLACDALAAGGIAGNAREIRKWSSTRIATAGRHAPRLWQVLADADRALALERAPN